MILTEENFNLFAAMHYLNTNCETQEEFNEDISRLKYIKKLFNLYESKNELKERLILNHIIILYNSFEAKACTKMLLMKMNGYYSYLLPFLIFLGYLPEKHIDGIHHKDHRIVFSDYSLDENVVKKLRDIRKRID